MGEKKKNNNNKTLISTHHTSRLLLLNYSLTAMEKDFIFWLVSLFLDLLLS